MAVDMVNDVRKFMEVAGQALPDKVAVPRPSEHLLWALSVRSNDLLEFCEYLQRVYGGPENTADDRLLSLRLRFIVEEVAEILQAAAEGDVAGVADGLADLQYVTVGANLAFGIPTEAVWNAVQKANLSKFECHSPGETGDLRRSTRAGLHGLLRRRAPPTRASTT